MELLCSVVEYSFSLEKAFGIVKDVILMAAAISGTVVAWKGLNTWNRQLKGQNEFALSRNILVSLYKYRDALNVVRNPMMWAHEMELTADELAGKSEDQIRYLQSLKGFEERWKRIGEVRSVMYAELIEAEALWGMPLIELFKPLEKLEWDLSSAIRDHLRALKDPNAPRVLPGNEKKVEERDATMNRPLGKDEPDPFMEKFTTAAAAIEAYVRSKWPHQ